METTEGPGSAATLDGEGFVVRSFEDARAALFDRSLSRRLDTGTFEEGNLREGAIPVLHGVEHRNRRRIENRLFRSPRLVLYERELFPAIIEELTTRIVEDGRADLFRLGKLLSVVLSARTAGIDRDARSIEELERLAQLVSTFAQASALEDAIGDKDEVRATVKQALREFDEEFVTPSRRRREEQIGRARAPGASGSELEEFDDVLTTLLLHADDEDQRLDDGTIVREVATYLQAGTHTSALTLANTFDLLFRWREAHPEQWRRQATSRLFLQRCVHETLRVRPTVPGIRRVVEEPTEVAGQNLPTGTLVIVSTYEANTDPAVFGHDAEVFDPQRQLPEGVPRWGLSFSGGMHSCIGRTLAVGMPAPEPSVSEAPDDHLYGLVTLMVEGMARRGVAPDPDRPPVPDTRTRRWTRWLEYPVRFTEGAGLG